MTGNSVIIRGNICADVVRRQAKNDAYFTHFRVASNRTVREDDGTWRTADTVFLEVQCWGNLATTVAETLSLGQPVIVTGRLEQSEWVDKYEQKRSDLRIRATSVALDLARLSSPGHDDERRTSRGQQGGATETVDTGVRVGSFLPPEDASLTVAA